MSCSNVYEVQSKSYQNKLNTVKFYVFFNTLTHEKFYCIILIVIMTEINDPFDENDKRKLYILIKIRKTMGHEKEEEG